MGRLIVRLRSSLWDRLRRRSLRSPNIGSFFTTQPIKIPPINGGFFLVGLAGFEPTNDGIKNRCLTTWRQPNLCLVRILYQIFYQNASIFQKMSKISIWAGISQLTKQQKSPTESGFNFGGDKGGRLVSG